MINKVADCIKEAEENDDIDKNERDRLLAELDQLRKAEMEKNKARQLKQQDRIKEQMLQRRLKQKQQVSASENSTELDKLSADAIDESISQNPLVLRETESIEKLTIQLDKELDIFSPPTEEELILKAHFDEKIKSANQSEAEALIAEYEKQRIHLEQRNKRNLKAALVARTAKLALMQKRKETAQNEALLEIMNNSSPKIENENEKEKILESINDGNNVDTAIYS